MAFGPLPDEYHRHELPGSDWVTCNGCPQFRVHDFHYFYCRQLDDKNRPDVAYSGGWVRIANPVFQSVEDAPCQKEPAHD